MSTTHLREPWSLGTDVSFAPCGAGIYDGNDDEDDASIWPSEVTCEKCLSLRSPVQPACRRRLLELQRSER